MRPYDSFSIPWDLHPHAKFILIATCARCRPLLRKAVPLGPATT
jgi:hypothetical protein